MSALTKVAIAVTLVVICIGGVSSYRSWKATEYLDEERQQDTEKPTPEQLLLLQTAKSFERLDVKMERLDRSVIALVLAQPKPAAKKKPVVMAQAKPVRSRRRGASSQRPRAGAWSKQAEASRMAWRRWADAEISRLRANNSSR